MDPNIFRFPPPYSGVNFPRDKTPHFMTSEGMLMPSHMQPPPMYGPRGSTIPPKFLGKYGKKNIHEKQHTEDDFYCETCDYDFTSKVAFHKHVSEHRTCDIDGCAFFAHPEIITRHIEQQHSTGLYEKIKDVNTPEEIAKWREERKKRYPTQANVALRQQVQAERLKRGERIGDYRSRFGQREDRRKCKQHEPGKENTNEPKRKRIRFRKRKSDKKGNENAVEALQEDSEEESDVKQFKGTANLPDYVRPVAVKKPKQKVKQNNALTSLAGLYGSDDDSDNSDDEESQEEAEKSEDEKGPENSNKSCEFNISSDEDDYAANNTDLFDILNGTNDNSTVDESVIDEPEKNESEIKDETNDLKEPTDNLQTQTSESEQSTAASQSSETVKTVVEHNVEPHPNNDNSEIDDDDQQVAIPFKKVVETFPDEDNTSKVKNTHTNEPKPRKNDSNRNNNGLKPSKHVRKRNIRKSGLDYSKLRRRPQNTMLEKLLQADIIHERNVLLQCVRYIVQKNFFGIGQTKTPESNVETC